ncbi:hypothetical protein, partial [Mesorhizobium sp.]|uniref:hypothetical protein n=1 Tax=Mesorhizobium sp. TaxID=1871066 RepID=UPI0025BE35B9
MIPSSRHSMRGSISPIGRRNQGWAGRGAGTVANRKYRKFLRNRSGFSPAPAPNAGMSIGAAGPNPVVDPSGKPTSHCQSAR